MILRPTKSTRTYTLFPYTTRCRSLERRHHDQDADAADDEGGHPEKRLAAAARRHVGWIVEALAWHGTRPRVERIEHRHGMPPFPARSEEHTSELQSIMRTSYAVFCLTKKKTYKKRINNKRTH